MEKLRTPDAPLEPVVYQQYIVTMPVNADMQRFIIGALTGISLATAWENYGTLTDREAANYVKEVIRSMMPFSLLGTIVTVHRESLDNSMLQCDGSVYNRDDYPQLWEVWPSAMKDATTLTLPDLRNLFLVGAGLDYELGESGGEAEVLLTIDEIPSHNHGYSSPTTNIDVESVGVPDPTGVGLPMLPASTDSTGGGEAHENRPPFYAVVYAVIAKVVP